jgi:Na+/H+-translocating membrane pyrophosphatase
VDAGFADPDTIRKEPGLQALADDPEFKRLVEVVTKRAEK